MLRIPYGKDAISRADLFLYSPNTLEWRRESCFERIECALANPLKLSKSDTRRAMVRHHFRPCASQMDAFNRLRSIQFDPLAPVGCNHDLVLQARVPGYKVGDWQKLAY